MQVQSPITTPRIILHEGDLPHDHPFQNVDSVAIDTEAMGLEVHRDRLCLVQLSIGNGECHLVHIRKGTNDAPYLKALLSDPSITKIFHFGRFDIAALYNHFGVLAAPVFCTKIASKLTRTYTDKHGLKELCRDIVKVEISKQEQTSDWGADVLSDDQKKYAARDVLYLHSMKAHFEALLERESRTDIAKAAFAFLPYRAQLDVLAGSSYDILSY